MHKLKRKQYIMEEIHKTGAVLVAKVAESLDVSTETIRRDLKELESEGHLIRMFGGAYIRDEETKSVPNILKETFYKEEKEHMAKLAIQHLSENNIIFLDASSTCLYIAKEIIKANLEITIITNSLRICTLIHDFATNIKLISLGGTYKKLHSAFTGPSTVNSISRYLADIAFISSPSLNIDLGLYDNSESSAQVRYEMIMHSKKCITVLDNTKLIEKSDYFICTSDMIDHLITNKKPAPMLKKNIESKHVTIEY